MTKWVKIALCTLGGLSVCYCIATLVFVVTAPDLRLRTLLVSLDQETAERFGPAVRLYAGPDSEDKIGAQAPPAPGDLLYEINGRRIRNFSDFSEALVGLRSAAPQPGGELPEGADPDELNSASSHTLLEIRGRKPLDADVEPEGERFMRVRFFRAGEDIRSTSWIKLQPLPAFGLILLLIWLVPQLLIFSLSAVAYWNRPHDRSARLFFVLSFVTLAAFVGGSHWWVVAGSPWFCVPFVGAAVLLPPVLLHLFVVYPTPRPVMLEWPRATLAAIYALPALFLIWLLGTIGLLFVLVGDVGVPGPFARLWESQTGLLAEWLLRLLRDGIVVYVGLAVIYFVLTICSLAHSALTTRPVVERREVQWLFRAGLLASVFVGYAAYLAFFRRVELALGAGQVPIFLASFSFLWAFAVGMVRYKLMLIDEVISRGMLFYVLSAFLTVLYSLVIAGGSVLA
jgi:hypothetical protein